MPELNPGLTRQRLARWEASKSFVIPRLFLEWLPGVAFLLILGGTLLAYWPGLSGPFLFDDFANLSHLGDYGGIRDWTSFRQFVLGGIAGPTGRPLSLLSFLINDSAWPTNPWSFKYTNLLLHLLTGSLLCWLILRLLRIYRGSEHDQISIWIAILASGLWITHPLHVSTTLYVIQRMTILSGLFVIAGLLGFVVGCSWLTKRPRTGYLLMSASIGLGTIFATLSKENGALLPLLALVVYTTLLAKRPRGQLDKRWLWVFLKIPSIVLSLYLMRVFAAALLHGYSGRDFGVIERLLTETRVIWGYIYELAVPHIQTAGLYHDNVIISRSLIQPPMTLFASAGLAVVAWIAWRARRGNPLMTLAIAFFFTGHLIESTVVGLELSFEHRNYVPAFFFALPLVDYVANRVNSRPLTAIAGTAAVAVLLTLSYQRSTLWGNELLLTSIWAEKNPASVRAQRTAAISLTQHDHTAQAITLLQAALEQHPESLELRLHLFILECANGQINKIVRKELQQHLAQDHYDFRTFKLLQNYFRIASSGRCPSVDGAYAFRSLKALQANPAYKSVSRAGQQIHHLLGSWYAAKGKGPEALAEFKQSFAARPYISSGLQQTAILATHHLYREALQHLDRVKNALHQGGLRERGVTRDEYGKRVAYLRTAIMRNLHNL